MKIKSTPIRVVMFALLLMFSIAAAASAGPFVRGRQGFAPGKGIMGLKTFIELNLSDDQKEKVLTLIEAFEAYREAARDSLLAAKETLSKAVQAEPFDEAQVKSAYWQSAALREALFVRRVKMMVDLKALLTPEQRELLAERKALRAERLKDRFEAFYQRNSP